MRDGRRDVYILRVAVGGLGCGWTTDHPLQSTDEGVEETHCVLCSRVLGCTAMDGVVVLQVLDVANSKAVCAAGGTEANKCMWVDSGQAAVWVVPEHICHFGAGFPFIPIA